MKKSLNKPQILQLKLILPILMALKFSEGVAKVSDIEVYLGNLEGQIQGETYRSNQEPESYLHKANLSDLWYEKSGYTGSPFDTTKAIDLSTEAIEKLKKQLPKKMQKTDIFDKTEIKQQISNLYLKRARYQMRLHQFESVRQDIQKAQELGASQDQVKDLKIDLNWNQGQYKPSLKLAQQELERKSNRINFIRLAGLKHELGQYQEANQYYQSAKTTTGDGIYFNPVQKAWLEVQIGINFIEMKEFEKSEAAFRSALGIAPDYVMALEHLAEFLAEQGRTDEAIVLYEKVIKLSEDPEFMGQLAKLYRLKNKTTEADQLSVKAKEKFNQLLQIFPEAMYWHAADFFLEEGQAPEKALELLEKNIKLRPNSSGYLALAKVQSQLNLKKHAKKSITKVLKMEPISGEMCDVAQNLLKKNNSLLITKCASILR